ncbi:MAG: adenosylcobinamide-GDP ribazoletransferase [Nannocystaceae bacterium]
MCFQGSRSQAFLHALLFLTRLPVARWARDDPESMRRSVMYYPAVGGVLGVFAAVVYSGMLGFGVSLAALAAVVTTVLLTGALHEDGLADGCDAFFGGRSREDVLRIMKDPRVGVFGAVALIVSVVSRWQLIAALPPGAVPTVLVTTHILSRATPMPFVAFGHYVSQPASKSRLCTRGLSPFELARGLLIAFVLAWVATPTLSWWFLPVGTTLVAQFWRRFCRRIGGYTGDCLGCVQQCSEIAVLVLALALGDT